MKLPCDCPACLSRLMVTTTPGHAYELDTDPDHQGWRWRWRWLCGCGSRGRWQNQSPNAAYHSWRKHVGLRE